MGLLGILLGLALLVALAYRGWSILLLAPAAALVAALFAGEPLLAHWTQTFMGAAAGFVAQFFPIFLLGALFGKLMEDSGSVQSVARFMGNRLGTRRAILAVVLAGAMVTYGGVSLFVAIFVLVPMAQSLFRDANIPRRLIPGTVALGTFTFTMTALPGTPAVQNAIPMPYLGTTPFAAPGLGLIAALIMLLFGLWWLSLAEARARRGGIGYDGLPALAPARTSALTSDRTPAAASVSAADPETIADQAAEDTLVRTRATVASSFDPPEVHGGEVSRELPSALVAFLPLIVVVAVNLSMSFLVLPRLDLGFLGEDRWGPTSPAAVSGIWSVIVALLSAILTLLALNWKRLTSLRDSVDAGLNASVLPVVSVACLVGFGAVVAALPAFEMVRDWVLGIEGGPLVSLAVSTNILAALTGSASGGLTIALQALGPTYLQLASELGIDPGLMHRVAVIGAGTLDTLPHNGAVVTLLAVCGATHKESYLDIVMVAIVGGLVALAGIIVLGTLFGSF
ncbi:GntP family permease [Thiohalocapsa marina]|uniref:GntP family permease n=1 Tax=Thiohalocapsa marina TaxID=424902 RepID=A0A5M8FSI9_9GAMM|nr:GntP family permease [Thiohalocapsa marina]KAA6186765.1 GntP family permease [Thiohalocapsa marina]